MRNGGRYRLVCGQVLCYIVLNKLHYWTRSDENVRSGVIAHNDLNLKVNLGTNDDEIDRGQVI